MQQTPQINTNDPKYYKFGRVADHEAVAVWGFRVEQGL